MDGIFVSESVVQSETFLCFHGRSVMMSAAAAMAAPSTGASAAPSAAAASTTGLEYLLLNSTSVSFNSFDSAVDVDETGRLVYVVHANMDVRVVAPDGSRDILIRYVIGAEAGPRSGVDMGKSFVRQEHVLTESRAGSGTRAW